MLGNIKSGLTYFEGKDNRRGEKESKFILAKKGKVRGREDLVRKVEIQLQIG